MSIAVYITQLFQRNIRISLENEKLKIDAPKGALTTQVKQELMENKQAIVEYLVEQKKIAQLPILEAIDRETDVLPMSSAQKRLWFLQQLEPNSGQYNVNALLSIEGSTDIDSIRSVFSDLIKENEIFHTQFSEVAGKPKVELLEAQSVDQEFEIECVELAANKLESNEYKEALQSAMTRPFDLANPPLFRLTQLKLGEHLSHLVLTFHHIVIDHWSLQLLTKQFVQKCQAKLQGGVETRAQSSELQYLDYAAWQNALFESDYYEELKAYWRETLGTEDYCLSLPTDRPKTPQTTHAGARYDFELTPELFTALKSFCLKHKVTPNTVLLAAYQWLLVRRSSMHEIRVACPVSERAHQDLESMLGLFVNTMVVKTHWSEGQTTTSWIKKVNEALSGAKQHSAMPFEKLVDELVASREGEHEPLAQTMFNYLVNEPSEPMQLADMRLQPLPVPEYSAKFDISLFANNDGSGISLSFQYRVDLFDRETVADLAQHYLAALEYLISAGDQPLALHSSLLNKERIQLQDWNDTAKEYDLPNTLAEALSHQQKLTPNHIALKYQNASWSYQELGQKVNQLANWLVAQGCQTEDKVAICMTRCPQMVVSILAAVKAGCAYLPLDPDHPQQRLDYIVEHAKPKVILVLPEFSSRFEKTELTQDLWTLDDVFSLVDGQSIEFNTLEYHPHQLAYVLYTSGSTGQPKGVAVPHSGVMNRIFWMQDEYCLGSKDVVLQKTPYSFDVSVWEFFWPLMTGATLVLAEAGEHKDSQRLIELIEKYQVTTLHFVPAMLQVFLDNPHASRCRSLRQIFCSGEALPYQLQQQCLSVLGAELHNLYGPTEASIDVTYWDCRKQHIKDLVPIGSPIANIQTWILDEELNPVPIGASGELYLGGIGLARGYLNRPDLTAKTFIPNPFAQDGAVGDAQYSRLYKTGDVARYLKDGSIEYVGRADFQVKIRGLRIELGEIEARIAAHSVVKEVVVAACKDEKLSDFLVAYIVAKDEHSLPELTQWQTYLLESLPEYMIPTAFVSLDAMPLSVNGKVDRKALPTPNLAVLNRNDFVAPRGEKELILAEIWQSLLGVEQIGINDNFFAIGGDSIVSLQVVARARDMGLRLEPKDIFRNQTIELLASVATQDKQQDYDVGDVFGEVPLAPIQQWYLNQALVNPDHFNQALLLASYTEVDVSCLRRALQRLVHAHPMLVARFNYQENTKQWVQSVSETDAKTDIAFTVYERHSLTDEEKQHAVSEISEFEQTQLKLAQGEVFRCALIHFSGSESRLLLVAHHLVVDGVSWRILLSQLESDYIKLCNKASLAPTRYQTKPFKRWSEQVAEYKPSSEGIIKWHEWQNRPESREALSTTLPTDPVEVPYPAGLQGSTQVCLSTDQTDRLLTHAGSTLRARIDELCLTALAKALSNWTQSQHHLISLEGHGRDLVDCDVSETVGWFTRLYPAVISSELGSWQERVLTVRRQLSALPESHTPFSAVKSFLSDALAPQLVFNYLGQLDNAQSSGFMQQAPEKLTGFRDPQNPLSWLLEVNAFISKNQLKINLQYSRSSFVPETIAQFGAEYVSQLGDMLDALCDDSPSLKGAVAADFPLANLSDDQAVNLVRKYVDCAVEDVYPLTPVQQGMLFHCLDHDAAYISQSIAKCEGALNSQQLQESWIDVVERHPALRTAVITDDVDEPHQVVFQSAKLPFEELDWQDISQADKDLMLQSLRQREISQIKFSQAPMMRVVLIKHSENHHQLVWTIHHLIMDGWCLNMLVGEVMQGYFARLSGEQISKQPAVPFRNFIEWLELKDEVGANKFWREQLTGFTSTNSLPAAYIAGSKPKHVTKEDAYLITHQYLGKARTAEIERLCQQNSLTLNTLVQGLWGSILSRYMGSRDVVYGVTTAGRPSDLPGSDRILGVFINTLPLRLDLNSDLSVLEWLTELQDKNLVMREFEQTPIARIQRVSSVPQDQVLFETLLVFENLPASDEQPQHGLTLTLDDHHVRNNFPLTLRVVPQKDLRLDLLLDLERVDHNIATKMIDELLLAVDKLINDANTLQTRVKDWVVGGLPKLQMSMAKPVGTLLERVMSNSGTATGLLVDEKGEQFSITYQHLLTQAEHLASYLPDITASKRVIALVLPREQEQIVAMLAAWWKGAAWLCIDPQLPAERVSYMLADANVCCVLGLDTPEYWENDELGKRYIWLNIRTLLSLPAKSGALLPPAIIQPKDTAYVIYTSGSTGQPKGVEVTHGNAISYVDALFERIDIEPNATMATLATVSADLGLTCVLGALVTGRTLALIPNVLSFDPSSLAQYLERFPIDVLKIVPSHLKALLAVEKPERLLPRQWLISGGESLTTDLVQDVRALLPTINVANHYGPTEATIGCMAKVVDDGAASITLGSELSNGIALIVDEQGLPVAQGTPGELLIAGQGVAKGYLNKPEQTAKSFTSVSVIDSEGQEQMLRAYKTGDKVSKTDNGEFIYLGRIDDQVKIRGYRVELNEIKQTLCSFESVIDCAVTAVSGPSGLRLAVCVVIEKEASLAAVKQRASEVLPEYMVPSLWMIVESLPLNPNGKVDRTLIAQWLEQSKSSSSAPREASAVDVENDDSLHVLTELWEGLLGQRPQPNDNLFSLGADSIICLQFIAKAASKGFKFTPKQIFSAPSVLQLSEFTATRKTENALAKQVVEAVNVQSTSKTEATLQTLWEELLKQKVNVDDNFFALGGDSIITLQMIAKAKQQGLTLTPKMVFEDPSIRMLAKRLEESATDKGENQSLSTVSRSSVESIIESNTEFSTEEHTDFDLEARESLNASERNKVLGQLTQIWQELFNLESIVPDAHFFELGGDSIMALQLIARLSKFDLKLTPKQIFSSPRLNELVDMLVDNEHKVISEPNNSDAKVLPSSVINTSLIETAVPSQQSNLLPIQHWFYEVKQPVIHHWNQAIMLALPQAVNHEAMSAAVEALIEKHAALASRFAYKQGAEIRQSHSGQVAGVYTTFDNQTLQSVEALTQHCQESLDLVTGPVFKVVAFNLKQGGARLLLVAHHLVVDGVSWRIIGNDLAHAYQAKCLGQDIELGQGSASVSDWHNALMNCSTDVLKRAREFWLPMAARSLDGQLLPGAQNGTIATADKTVQVFDEGVTQSLIRLGSIHGKTGCEVAMLSALSQALCNQFNKSKVMIELEGHGRELLDSHVDLSETVGWFTSRYPVTFSAQQKSLEEAALTLSQVPNNGVGYGVLRYLKQELAFEHPQLVFNYLGQVMSTNGEWQLVADGVGKSRHPESLRRQLIEVTAQIREGQLYVSWQYPSDIGPKLKNMFEQFETNVKSIVASKAESQNEATLERSSNVTKIKHYPLTPIQQGMFLHSASAKEPLYFNQTTVELEGELDVDSFVRAWQQTVDAEAILNAAFEDHGDKAPTQWFSAHSSLPMSRHDWCGKELEWQQAQLKQLCETDREKGFDLAKPPLMRLHLIKVNENRHWLVWSRHHLIVDAWCSSIIIKDMVHRYLNLIGKVASLPSKRPPFTRYLDWLGQQDLEHSKRFWNEELKGFDSPLKLVPGQSGEEFTLEDHTLSHELTQNVKELAKRKGVTLNAVIQAAWAQTLAHHSGQHNVVFGMTTSGRPAELAEAHQMVGIFINTLPVRVQLNPMLDIGTLLQNIHQQGVRLREYEYTPLSEIIAQSEINRDQSLFDSLLVFENEAMSERSNIAEHLTVTPLDGYERNSYPLSITVMPRSELVLRVGCDGERLSYSHVIKMVETFKTVLESMVFNCDQLLGNVMNQPTLLPSQFVDQSLRNWSESWTLETEILSVANTSPQRIAVSDTEGVLTYQQLVERATYLAQSLSESGIGCESKVAVCQRRGVDMLVSLLAVYWSGAVYIPVDPNQPKERLALILEQASPALMLADESVTDFDHYGCVKSPQQLLNQCTYDPSWMNTRPANHPEQLAYIIFTSGSTGVPKGVQISRTAFANFLQSMLELTQIQAPDRLLAVTTIGFDIAGLEMFLPLISGGQVFVASYDDARDASQLARLIDERDISFMQATPVTWQMLAEQESVNWSALTVLTGGEALPAPLASYMVEQGAKVMNVYGPTETTVWSSMLNVDQQQAQSPSLGLPIANTNFYVLDDWLNPVAVGAEGELYIGGQGLARGYAGQASLTAQTFTPDPFSTQKGARMYATGDIVRIGMKGQIEFVGRKDFQLKLRGYRIEAGDIEAALAKITAVKESAVKLCYPDSAKACLIGYVTLASGEEINTEQVLERLRKSLPFYMVPKRVVVLQSMPLNANNKIDRKALPEPEDSIPSGLLPATETEIWLAEEWQALLDSAVVFADDDFFAIGGNSLLAGRFVSGMKKKLGIELPLTQLFRFPVLRDLARLIEEQSESNNASVLSDTQVALASQIPHSELLVCLNQGSSMQPPLFVFHPAGGHVKAYEELVSLFPKEQTVYGIQSPQLVDLENAPDSVNGYASLYVDVIRSVQKTGAVRLLGWSFGAWLAVSVTRLLEAKGERVEWLGLVDARANPQRAVLTLPTLPNVSRYLACLDNEARRFLLGRHAVFLDELELRLQSAIDTSRDDIAFNAFSDVIHDTELGRNMSVENKELYYLQMKLFMTCHSLMQNHQLEMVSTPIDVWWASDTLIDRDYQHGASEYEWDAYGKTNVTILDGDHNSIIRDVRLANGISHKLNRLRTTLISEPLS
ncbi:amino acid adenylation domain-containing protein [Vibrio fortis]|uniref:amino acid adenylation domain-containing protein n=1 Tax=Vibrio fortis TaxID=212667 RepID=UPI0038CD6F3E